MTRLPVQPGERIDRSRPITFTFDGKTIPAYEGDTIASALYAHGRRTFSRSFKYHRPRGELCGCGQCANSLVQIGGRPGVRACAEPVSDGLVVTHTNAQPGLDFDVMRATDIVGGPFTPARLLLQDLHPPAAAVAASTRRCCARPPASACCRSGRPSASGAPSTAAATATCS